MHTFILKIVNSRTNEFGYIKHHNETYEIYDDENEVRLKLVTRSFHFLPRHIPSILAGYEDSSVGERVEEIKILIFADGNN